MPATLDFVAVISLLMLGLLAFVLRGRLFRPAERIQMRAAAWSLLRESPASENKSETESPRDC